MKLADQVSDTVVRFESVSKTYDGQTRVVADLDLDVRRGEFLTLLGPSGSGKTTALMMLAGFEMPTTGRILLEGRNIGNMPPHQRGIGVVFQNYALFPHMTVGENIAFPLRVRKLKKPDVDAAVKDALAMVRLDGLASRRPGQLSGGQQQRVALARALVFRPPIVIMDEPLGALDKSLREEMQSEIKVIHRSLGVTIVYVTHDQGEALTMSDRIAVFQRGRVVQLDEPRAVYDRPTNLFVAKFLGENNVLEASVVSEGAASQVGQVALDGASESFACLFPNALATGDPAFVLIRPEDVLIGDDAVLGDIRLRGTVEAQVYHGDHIRLSIRLECGQTISARCRPGQSSEHNPGRVLEAGWRVPHAVAITRDA